MKKLFVLTISLIMALCCLAVGCNPQQEADKKEIVIAAPDGAPALAIYELLKNLTELDGHKVTYKIVAGASNIGTIVTSGEADIAVMPTNIAAKLYNNGVKIKLFSINSFGNLYMVGNTKVNNPEELLGKIVINIGRGGTPDITTKLILDKNNIAYEESETAIEGKVALRYVSESSEAIALLKQGKGDYAVLGEPAATNAVKKINVNVCLDLQREWNNLVGTDSFTQFGVVLNQSVYSDNGLIEALFEKLESNLTYVYNDTDNIKEVLANNGSALTVDFTQDIITRCNLKNKKAKEIKTQIENYFNAIILYDATFIGGKLPDDVFYY